MDKAILTAVIVAAASFVMQKTLNNFIYGVVILITRPFKKGDKVVITQSGRELASGNVIKRGVLHIHIKDYNRNVCIIPNSVLETCTIINSDYKAGVNYINRIKVSFDSDLEQVKSLVFRNVIEHQQTQNTEENTHIISKYGEGGITLEYNVRTPDTNTSFDVCSEIVDRIVTEISGLENVALV